MTCATIELIEATISVELNEAEGLTVVLEDLEATATTELVAGDEVLTIAAALACVTTIGETEQLIELVLSQSEIAITEIEERIELISIANPALGLPSNMFAANCTAAEEIHDLVFIAATSAVRRIDIDDSAKMPVAGVIVSKTSDTDCVVQFAGRIDSLSGLLAGARYWAGTDSKVATPRPSDPVSGIRSLQVIGNAFSSTELVINIDQTLMRVRP